MKRNVKIISVIIGVVFILIYGVYSLVKPLDVETKTLERQKSELYFIETGVVVNPEEQYIYSSLPGTVKTILVEEGDNVKKGDILMTLDTQFIDNEYAAQQKNLEGYQAQLNRGEIEIATQRDTLKGTRENLQGQLEGLKAEMSTDAQKELRDFLVNQSKAQYEQGLADLEKQQKLYDEGYISKKELETFQNSVENYEGIYLESQVAGQASDDYYASMEKALKGQINAINQTLERDLLTPTKQYYQSMIDSTLEQMKTTEIRREEHSIRAPFDGVVSQVLSRNANRIQGVEPLFFIIGNKENYIETMLQTRDIETVQIGSEVKLIHHKRSGEVELTGVVTYIGENAIVERSPLGIEERKVMVKVQPEANDIFKVGFEVDVKFILFEAEDQLIVPLSAMYKIQDEDYVMVIREGVAVEQKVVLGQALTGAYVVIEGLKEGDEVIIDLDVQGLTVGKRVKKS